MVAGIIISEFSGLQLVFFPLYFGDSWFLRGICTTPIYIGVFMLSWTWIKCIISDPGMIQENSELNYDQIQHVKKEAEMHFRRVTAIKKYLSINPEAFVKHYKKVYDEFPEEMKKLDNRYKNLKTLNLKMELHNAMFSHLEYSGYCQTCNIVKAPRAHHCKTCKRCYLRMDHHCPWIGNCVGVGNHKFFIQFTGYAGLTLLLCFLEEFIAYYFTEFPPVNTFEDTVMNVNMWTMLVLGGAIFFLFTYQFKNGMRNVTTVEDNFPQLADQDQNPFSRGKTKIENLETIFGKFDLVNWLIPTDSKPIKEKFTQMGMIKTNNPFKADSEEFGHFVA